MTPRACFLLPRASDAWQPHRRGRSGGVADAIGRSIDRSIRQNKSVDRLIDSISTSPRDGVNEDDDADSRPDVATKPRDETPRRTACRSRDREREPAALARRERVRRGAREERRRREERREAEPREQRVARHI